MFQVSRGQASPISYNRPKSDTSDDEIITDNFVISTRGSAALQPLNPNGYMCVTYQSIFHLGSSLSNQCLKLFVHRQGDSSCDCLVTVSSFKQQHKWKFLLGSVPLRIDLLITRIETKTYAIHILAVSYWNNGPFKMYRLYRQSLKNNNSD